MTLRNSPKHPNRPRERLMKLGTQALTDTELLAVLLGTGMKGVPVLSLAAQLLKQCGGLKALLARDTDELMTMPGLGCARSCQLSAILALARRAMQEELNCSDTLEHPERVKILCQSLLGHLHVEHCIALFLDNQNRLIATEEISRGTLTQTSIYPRELVKAGLKHHARSLILAHNHPSGLAQASAADVELTRQLKQSLLTVDILLLDHLIVAGPHVVSLSEHALM